MSEVSYCIELLNDHHHKANFSCGVDSLDRYLTQEAGQHKRKRVAATYVLTYNEAPEIIGYYTLSSTSVDLGLLPEKIGKKFPRYPMLPATLLGRLAIDKNYQGKNYGELLLIDALKRSFEASGQVGSIAIIVDAESDSVINFYKKYGFILLSACKNKLFLPMKSIEQLLS